MYLTRPQLAGIRAALNDPNSVPKEMMDFFINNGLIEHDMFDWRVTEKGGMACRESRNEHELQDADNKTGPSEKGEFFRERRTVFTNDDQDLVIPKKRKSAESMTNIKPKPVTKYKESK